MPFGPYLNHADCVAKNKDKADPDAFCASIKRNIKQAKKRKRFSRRIVE